MPPQATQTLAGYRSLGHGLRLCLIAALVACSVARAIAAPLIAAPPFWHFAVIAPDSTGTNTQVLEYTFSVNAAFVKSARYHLAVDLAPELLAKLPSATLQSD